MCLFKINKHILFEIQLAGEPSIDQFDESYVVWGIALQMS